MFKKKPQIKNLSPLRSSDRRRLADQIISEFSVQVPEQIESSQDVEDRTSCLAITDQAPPQNSYTSSPPTLTSIRNSILPENCSSARFTTLVGADSKVVSGTVYIGAHPGLEERILWLQWGANTQRLYPTVYTLWANPGLLPLLLTPGLVMDKLMTGADLMTPGLWGGPPWPPRAKKGSLVAVARMELPGVPVWLGTCEIDVSALGIVYGLKGKAVDGVHWAGDEIWTWSSSATGGREPPAEIKEWEDQLSTDPTFRSAMHFPRCGLKQVQGQPQLPLSEVPALGPATNVTHEPEKREAEDDSEPTTQEVDNAFQQAFLYSVYSAKQTGSPPYYGLDLPGIQPSYMVEKMIKPHLKSRNQHYTIKKTSWRTTKKFIKHLDKQGIVKAKDRNGGETIIQDIDFEDPQIQNFAPYKLPNFSAESDMGQPATVTLGPGVPPGQLALEQLYRASSKLVPELIPSRTEYYTRTQISDFIRTYIENNADLSNGVSSKRFIKLNPFIANNILGSTQSASDTQILSNGEIARDALRKRVLEDDHLCMPFWILHGSYFAGTYNPYITTPPKPKPGYPPKITITIEKRTGTKTVTTVTGLEMFNINSHDMGPGLQKMCASSASVSQASGLKPGMMEIMVQGDQRDAVIKEAGKRGVKREWFEIVDKTKKKGK